MTKPDTSGWEQRQAAHFNRIASNYERHYSDAHSQQYRLEFFNRPMLDDIPLRGMHVLEGMCGSGQTTDFLLAGGAMVTGLDISSELIQSFRERWPTCEALCVSILDTQRPSNSLNAAIVVGGLHHLHPHVPQALDEIHRVLKPGGYFCFVEPHAGSLPDLFRRLWYRHDSLFEANERSLDLSEMMAANESRFDLVKVRCLGNIAYVLVLNSLIVRVPLVLKAVYAPVLMAIERVLSPLLTRRTSCFMVCQWRKR